MFGIKISPKTFFENRRFVKEAKRQLLKEMHCEKAVKHVTKNGTIALLGYQKDSAHFSYSLAKMPNGDVLGKRYMTGAYWLPFKTHIRQITSRLSRANNTKVPAIERIYRRDQFGKDAKPIIQKNIESNLGYMRKTTNTEDGTSSLEIFFAETGRRIKKSFDAAGKLISRTEDTIDYKPLSQQISS